MSPSSPGSRRRAGLLAWVGSLVSFAAMVTYFTVAVRWPALRDSGHANVALAAVGVLVSVVGLRRTGSSGKRLWPARVALGLGIVFAGFLAAYIYFISYQLPPADGVIAVGAKAPGFRLKDQEGRERTLEELDSKRLIIIFFRGHG
jgi:peptidoglycan/LPS O-acetylase OafA/YrhL